MGQLDEFANQGVYLVNQHGAVVASSCPVGLDVKTRQTQLKTVEERPYFRMAQSNRTVFISDIFESAFNGNATITACLPLLDGGVFRGLLFSAFQLSDTGFTARVRKISIPQGASLLVTDANGVLVLPSTQEITSGPGVVKIAGESSAANVGYSYWELIQVSRRDKRIDRLMQNVVPLSQDDDVFPLAPDAVAYSVVTELVHARWKVALTRFLRIRH